MEILFFLLLFGVLGKGTTKAVMGDGKKRKPTSRRLGFMIILDIVIRITDRGVDAATSYLTFFFSLCLAIAVGLLIWINTPRGKKWIDEL